MKRRIDGTVRDHIYFKMSVFVILFLTASLLEDKRDVQEGAVVIELEVI